MKENAIFRFHDFPKEETVRLREQHVPLWLYHRVPNAAVLTAPTETALLIGCARGVIDCVAS